MFRSILCAVDFSEQSRHALRWADRLCGSEGRLIVVSVVDPLLAGAARTRFGFDLAADVAEALQDFVSTTVSKSVHQDARRVMALVGQTNDVIRKIARQEHADLIALGTHGLGGFRKWLLGSTTEQLLRGTPVPVLAVPLIDALDTGAEHCAQPVEIDRILAATDFSVPGNDAVTYAVDLSRAEGASLLIAHVVSPVAVAPQWRSYVGGVDEENASRARARLEDLSRRLSSDASRVPTELVVRVGRPADGIAEIAQQHHSHVIVLGIVGESRDLAQRPGSIAYRVLCQAGVPVLVVPPVGQPL